jgi:hypothetical protein
MNKTGIKTLNLLIEVYGKNTFAKIRYFDDAVIGFEVETKRLIYSVKKCVKVLKTKMPTEEAIEHFYSEIYSDEKYFGNVIFCEDYLIKKPNI